MLEHRESVPTPLGGGTITHLLIRYAPLAPCHDIRYSQCLPELFWKRLEKGPKNLSGGRCPGPRYGCHHQPLEKCCYPYHPSMTRARACGASNPRTHLLTKKQKNASQPVSPRNWYTSNCQLHRVGGPDGWKCCSFWVVAHITCEVELVL